MDERWALVTGATGGLGGEISKDLLRLGYHLLAVGRDIESLANISADWQEHIVDENQQIIEVCVDLQSPHATREVMSYLGEKKLTVVVLAAADYIYGSCTDIQQDRHIQLIQCNIATTSSLIQALLMYMDRYQNGHMLVIGSLGALMPTPFQGAYTSSKAWLHQFVASMQAERRNAAVSLTLGCPGGMATSMLLDSPGWERLKRYPWVRYSILSPQRVSKSVLRAMFARRLLIIPGRLNWLTALFMRHMPYAIRIRIGRLIYGSAIEEN